MTPAEEDYISAIYHLAIDGRTTVNTKAIAARMNTKPSSVTDTMKKLADRNLVVYKKYKGVSLTDGGTTFALAIIRRQRLWEIFLVKKLNLTHNQSSIFANQLNHIDGGLLADKLENYPGNPNVDIHGNPMLKKEGVFMKSIKKLIPELPVESIGICEGVNDSSVEFFKILAKNKIALGAAIHIIDKEEFDGSVRIETARQKLHISSQIASNLFLELTD